MSKLIYSIPLTRLDAKIVTVHHGFHQKYFIFEHFMNVTDFGEKNEKFAQRRCCLARQTKLKPFAFESSKSGRAFSIVDGSSNDWNEKNIFAKSQRRFLLLGKFLKASTETERNTENSFKQFENLCP